MKVGFSFCDAPRGLAAWPPIMSAPTPRLSRVLSISVLLALAAWPAGVAARIGETPSQVAARLVQNDLGKAFTWPRDMNPREREREAREHPLRNVEQFLPSEGADWRELMFWKSAVRGKLSNDNGWRVHVYFFRGVSAVECYRRVGASLSEAEVNAILGRMRGALTWRRAVRPAPAGQGGGGRPAAAEDTVIGYDYELVDGETVALRAKRQGDWLVVYSKGFDDLLMVSRAHWNENEAKRKAEERAKQEELAPVSVDGF